MTVLATISVKNNAGKNLSIKLRLVSIATIVRLTEKILYCIECRIFATATIPAVYSRI